MKFAILGGIGNGSVIAAAIRHASLLGSDVEIVGYLNDRVPVGDSIESDPVIGTLQDAPQIVKEDIFLINAILRIDGNELRTEMVESLGLQPENFGTFIHPSSYVPPDTQVEHGCVIMPHVLISPGAQVKAHSLIMVGASVGHNTILEEFTHVAAQAAIGSHVRACRGVHIGLNANGNQYFVTFQCLGRAVFIHGHLDP